MAALVENEYLVFPEGTPSYRGAVIQAPDRRQAAVHYVTVGHVGTEEHRLWNIHVVEYRSLPAEKQRCLRLDPEDLGDTIPVRTYMKREAVIDPVLTVRETRQEACFTGLIVTGFRWETEIDGWRCYLVCNSIRPEMPHPFAYVSYTPVTSLSDAGWWVGYDAPPCPIYRSGSEYGLLGLNIVLDHLWGLFGHLPGSSIKDIPIISAWEKSRKMRGEPATSRVLDDCT